MRNTQRSKGLQHILNTATLCPLRMGREIREKELTSRADSIRGVYGVWRRRRIRAFIILQWRMGRVSGRVRGVTRRETRRRQAGVKAWMGQCRDGTPIAKV